MNGWIPIDELEHLQGWHHSTYPYNADVNEDSTYKQKNPETNPETKPATYLNYAGKIVDSDMMKQIVLRFGKFIDGKVEELRSILDAARHQLIDEQNQAEVYRQLEYKIRLYETIKCEISEFPDNDYNTLLNSVKSYDAG